MNSCSIGWFGKLPLSPEFIKHHYVGPVFAELDQWIQEGLVYTRSHLDETWADDYMKAGPWNFLWCSPEQDELLIGVTIPSTDKAGRHFPFLMFLRIPQRGFQNRLPGMPVWCHEFLEEARLLGEKGWQGKDLATFKAECSRLTLPDLENPEWEKLQDHYHEFLENHSTESFLTHLFGENDISQQADLLTNIKNIQDSAPLGRSFPSHVGLKLPLAPSGSPIHPFDLLFWADMAARLVPPHTAPTNIFWNRHQSPEHSYMMLYFKKPGPQTLLSLIRPGTEDSTLHDCSLQAMDQALSEDEGKTDVSLSMEHVTPSLQEWLNQLRVESLTEQEKGVAPS